MPQSTNLNKNPYYDDFSDSNNFYKVLFKPGVTVQTRELTTLQSILQNQIEKLGGAFFKKNSVVVPGGFAYDSSFYAVEVESTYKGVDVESYFNNLVGTTLTGKISNVTAKVEKVLSRMDSTNGNTTFYIKYQASSSLSFNSTTFSDGEELVVNQNINLTNSFILSGSSVAKTIAPTNRTSTSVGSAAKIDDGIYFVRGFFVNVLKDTLILDQYTNTPSYRVGLYINEEVVDANQDPSLYDNAQGFSNYAAPGADRLKISLSLTKKALDDFRDENFIELFRVDNGTLIQIKNQTDSSYITDILAKRTFDEAGNFYVSSFNVESLESLNDNLGNGGLYTKDQTSGIGTTPSENIGIIKVSPGKAYVKGYEVPTNTEILAWTKPRTTKNVQSSSSAFYTGNLLRVNHTKNIPTLGLTNNTPVTLYNQRLVSNAAPATSPIGVARVYDFSSHITSYNSPASQSNLHLFDIQTYSNIISDSSLSSINIGDYIKGNSSGATGFVQGSSGQTLTLSQVSGSFIKNESIIVNGINSVISIGTFTSYGIEDIKSISDGTFASDSVLSKEIVLTGPFTLAVDSGIGTISSNNGYSFASNLKISDIVKFSQSGIGSDIYASIASISTLKNAVTLTTVDTVPGVCSGNLGVSTSLQNISVIRPQIFQTDDPTLTSKLNNKNISNVSFLNSSIFTKVSYNSVSKSSTTLTLPSLSGTDYVYSTYYPERYTVINADGSTENLDNATLTITNGGKTAQFTNLSATAGPCRVITTQIKSNVSQKSKKLTRCNSLTIVNTKYNPSTKAGLTYTSVYGTRVEDDQISLNTSDILRIHGVFESSTGASPTIPFITISGLNSVNSITTDLIVGELVVGATSGAVAIYAQNKTTSQIYIIYKNSNNFTVGETVTFSESGYTATVTSVVKGDKNIVDEYTLDNGQRSHFYDFGRLIKKPGTNDPAGRLTIFFDNFTYDSNDYGDLISVNSYPSTLSKSLIPSFDGNRNTDIIDIRPKVTDYTTSSLSPFDFSSRTFNIASNNPSQILSPDENFVFDYDFYLPRTDKLTLSKDGTFAIVFGDPSENPIAPTTSNEVLDVATIVSSAYVYNIKSDVQIQLTDHRRYTMADVRNIDNRVANLEYYTTLSLLEKSTQNLLITDVNGLNRFKSGFFVDEFNNYDTSDTGNLEYNALIENKILSAQVQEEKIDLSLFSTDNFTPLSQVDLTTTNCNNLRLTGNKLSLNYGELISVQQPFASKIVNVNPFNIITWSGVLELSPYRDNWVVTINNETSIPSGHRGYWTTTSTSLSLIPYVRTRNINFTAARLKPNTRFRLLFDKQNIDFLTRNSKAFPKLLEITNNVGSFQVGETVNCFDANGYLISNFRVCAPNHKAGPIDSPTLVFSKNPYNPSVGISSQYGPQSTLLNIDVESLSRNDISGFWGHINAGNTLVGTTSNASATVLDSRLITNEEGVLIGSIWIDQNDRFPTGKSSVDLVLYNNDTLLRTPGEVADSSASSIYVSRGLEVTNTTIHYYDPLAQTFLVEDKNGIFPTSVDVYFYSKDSTIPVELQIREVSFGTPGGSDKVILNKVLSSHEVRTSLNATAATTFKFDTLTRLTPGEYAIVLLSDSDEYKVWVSELGAEDISTVNLPTINKVFITKQPSTGTLFKSQNGSTWVPSPLEDLKFNLNKAVFSTAGGTARFYNSTSSLLSPENKLGNNPITAISNSGYPNSGRHILVFHPNHGMHSSNDQVQIIGVQSDTLPEKLTISYASTSTGPINVTNTAIFTNFEGTAVSNANPGYIQIGNEIIQYESVGSGQLSNITRGVYGTIPTPHNLNDLVYKYEFNNVSLNRINTTYNVLSDPKPTLDTYYIQVSSGSLFTQTKTAGGNNVYATRNKQFSEVEFNPDLVTKFNSTQVSASIRTITSTSVDGNEVSYVDGAFESVGITSTNKLSSVRMAASRVNELALLNSTNFVDNRSFTLELNLNTSDSNVSPLIDLTQNYITTKIYSINQPIGISSYASDNRVNSNTNDPHSFVHISNKVNLEQSATSLQVLFSAYRNPASDIRVLYKIFTNNSPDEQQVWQLFPGYDNLDVNRQVINSNNNDGRSDVDVRSSLNDEYLDYTYTIDHLPAFTGFQIKIVGTSTNQAYSPLIQELRVIALK